jgi:hypothetical protein
MPDNGIDWVKRFGKAPNDMDEGEWKMAVAVMLMESCQSKSLLDRLNVFFKVAIIIWPVLLGFISWVAISLVRHISGY